MGWWGADRSPVCFPKRQGSLSRVSRHPRACCRPEPPGLTTEREVSQSLKRPPEWPEHSPVPDGPSEWVNGAVLDGRGRTTSSSPADPDKGSPPEFDSAPAGPGNGGGSAASGLASGRASTPRPIAEDASSFPFNASDDKVPSVPIASVGKGSVAVGASTRVAGASSSPDCGAFVDTSSAELGDSNPDSG